MSPELEKDVAVLDAVRDQQHARRLVKRARYKRVNNRRVELIRAHADKDDPEYQELQRIVRKIVDLAHPLPLEFAQELHATLRRLEDADADPNAPK